MPAGSARSECAAADCGRSRPNCFRKGAIIISGLDLTAMTTRLSEENQNMKSLEKDPPPVDLELIAQGVRMILEGLGEDPERPGLQETPRRVAEMYAELTSGMREDATEHVVPLPGDK